MMSYGDIDLGQHGLLPDGTKPLFISIEINVT